MTLTSRSIVHALIATLAFVPAAVSAQQSSRGTTRPSGPAALGIQGFSVVLVVGSLTGTAPSASDGVPEAARKALADMKDFLPFKRYQLLDAAWTLCCATSRSGVSGRVRGPDERDYRYDVDPLGVTDSKLNLRFTIREMVDPVLTTKPPAQGSSKVSDSTRLEHSRLLYDAIRERDEAEIQLRRVSQQYEVGIVAASEMESAKTRNIRAAQRVADLQRVAASNGVQLRGTGQNIIDSTFSISLGETVVVGTSRLHGDRALIAILTAAGKPASANR